VTGAVAPQDGRLTKKDVAGMLRMSEREVNRVMSTGELNYIRNGEVLRFSPEDVEEFERHHRSKRRR
jgi:hypothetical protein